MIPLDNVTLSNETITKLANETITALTNDLTQTLTAINQSATDQARLNQEARRNATAAIFEAFPTSMSYMLGLSIVSVIVLPVAIDLLYRKDRSREERSDLYRALMTFGVIIVVGLVIIYLIGLINFNVTLTNNDNVEGLIDVLKNLSTIVGTALAAIVAFYFGGKV
jgi:Na+/proline symporter